MERKRYISVILPLRLEWEPCYALPEGMEAVTGDRVRVMFSGKEYVGIVSGVDIEPQTVPSKIRPVLKVEEGMGTVSLSEIEFWRELATYYLCTVGEVCKAAYPAGKISLESARARALAKAEEREMIARKKEEERVARKKAVLEKRLEMRRAALARAKKESVKARLENEIMAIGCELSEMELQETGQAPETAGESGGSLPCREMHLSDAQEKACGEIREGFDKEKVVLLEGVTGSGKTEIYVKLALETMCRGMNVLYLVPEIALSRQLEERLESVFGDRLMVFHSGETPARRLEIASAVRECPKKDDKSTGNGYIVLGTRSSVFLPHHNLGLVIVDEEHDSSYKQDSPAPRYNGRDAAIMLAAIHGSPSARCNVLLGTATPSLESRYNCLAGKFRHVRLTERYFKSDDAEVIIIDTVAERKKRGMVGSFSRKLIDIIGNTLDKGEQVVVLRARRSYSPVTQCADCGFVPKCSHCNVSLSYHKRKGRLVCHYCGHSVSYMEHCPECGGPMIGLGAGTQKIEEELAALFPDAAVARLDSDTMQSKAAESRVIKGFADGDVDILVGTQIVTKGFDFSNLSLVAVIQADTLMGMQDFRADEKAVQILEQFRGRCGRRGRKGRFVIQTAQPEHPVYRKISEGESVSFANELLLERQSFGYPPFTRIVNVSVRDRFEERADRMASELSSSLGGHFLELAGPFVPGTGKHDDWHIRMIRVSMKRDKALVGNKYELKRIVSEFETLRNYQGHIVLDVDPA